MRILYIDCGMGAAGDMMAAALLELLPESDQEKVIDKLNHIGLDGVRVERSRVRKCGISGSHFDVRVNGISEIQGEAEPHHHHAVHMSDIEKMIGDLDLTKTVKRDALAVYGLIAEAESHAHGTEVNEIHFHEVGMKDAVMDVTAVCMLMEHISPDRVTASPVHTGSGQVKCSHGIMPVPAPATAYLLRDIPIYNTDLKGELCTPTGAALLKYFADDFGPMPVMKSERTGYGMGSRDYPVMNGLRIIQGETETGKEDTVVGLSCNVDDMTGEEIGFAIERLYEAGAREVYTVPTEMKKSRPGILLEVLCDPADKDALVRAVFKHTSTIGLRETTFKRYILDRKEEHRDTVLGRVRLKHSEGYGVIREKYEYDDMERLAKEKGLSLSEVREKLN